MGTNKALYILREGLFFWQSGNLENMGTNMRYVVRYYCDHYRGGVHPSDLRFFLDDGERVGALDETPLSLELEEDVKIHCVLPHPRSDDAFLAIVGAAHLIGQRGNGW